MSEESIDTANIDLKIPKEVLDFLHQMAVRVEIAEGGKYLYMPYWIEIRDQEQGLVRLYNLDNLPEDLRSALFELRGVQGTGVEDAVPQPDLAAYCKHLPYCNIMQDWSEAEDAFANTPMKFRDGEWEQAVEEMNRKKNTCTCGLAQRLSQLKDDVITDVEFEDDENTGKSSTDPAGEPTGEK